MLMLVFPVVMFKSHPFMDSLKGQQCWWWWYWCYKLLERAKIHQHDCICISFPFWVVEGVVVVKVVLFTFIQILCEKSLPFGSFFVLGGSSDEYCRLEPIVLPLSFITPYLVSQCWFNPNVERCLNQHSEKHNLLLFSCLLCIFQCV